MMRFAPPPPLGLFLLISKWFLERNPCFLVAGAFSQSLVPNPRVQSVPGVPDPRVSQPRDVRSKIVLLCFSFGPPSVSE